MRVNVTGSAQLMRRVDRERQSFNALTTDEKGWCRLDTAGRDLPVCPAAPQRRVGCCEAGIKCRGARSTCPARRFRLSEGKSTDIFTGLVGE